MCKQWANRLGDGNQGRPNTLGMRLAVLPQAATSHCNKKKDEKISFPSRPATSPLMHARNRPCQRAHTCTHSILNICMPR
jgi:hypothetical protein